MSRTQAGFAPHSVVAVLRVEGLVALAAALVAYQALGGNWWVFAALLLLPDLAMLGALAGNRTGALLYNLAHTYAVPATLAALGQVAEAPQLWQLAAIWMAHIGMDRALGYGLKYPGFDHHTHLGLIGKARRGEQSANAGQDVAH